MDNFDRRVPRKEKRNYSISYNGIRKHKRKGRFVLTKRGKILYWIIFLLFLCVILYNIKGFYKGTNTIRAQYASVTGDIISISPKLSGKVSDLNVKEGDVVSEDEVVFTLDTELLKNQVDEAYAQQQLAFERLESAGGGLKGELTSKNKKHRAKKNNSANKTEDIVMLQNAVKEAQSKYNLAKLALNNSNVLSPGDGTIIECKAHVGDYVSPARGVMSMVDFKKLNITAYIKQQELDNISNGDSAKITMSSLQNKTFLGKVISIGKTTAGMSSINNNQNIVSSKKLQAFIPIIISFDYSSEQLVPGLEAKVIIETNR